MINMLQLVNTEDCKHYTKHYTKGQIYWCGNGNHRIYGSLNGYKYHLKIVHYKDSIIAMRRAMRSLISEKEADKILDDINRELRDNYMEINTRR